MECVLEPGGFSGLVLSFFTAISWEELLLCGDDDFLMIVSRSTR